MLLRFSYYTISQKTGQGVPTSETSGGLDKNVKDSGGICVSPISTLMIFIPSKI